MTVNYSVTNCDGTVTSPNLLPGSRFKHCLKGGTFPTVNSPIGGLLGEYECGTTCTVAGNCSDCGPAPTPTPTPTQTQTQTPTPTPTPTATTPAVWYQIFDCDDSSTAYSIAYIAGVFANSERCTAVSAGYPTRTVIITGTTSTEPGGPLYTLTSQGASGCTATQTPTATPTQTPTPSSIPPTPTPTPTPTVAPTEAFIDISNGTASESISNITVNGVQITDVVFPIAAGAGASGKTNQVGSSETLTIFYSGGGGASITFTNTSGTNDCVNTVGPARTFASAILAAGGSAFITFEDGACS